MATTKSKRQRYPTDLTDAQWANIEHLFAPPKAPGKGPGGRPRTYPLREIVNAVFHIGRSGCSGENGVNSFFVGVRPFDLVISGKNGENEMKMVSIHFSLAFVPSIW